MKMTSVYVDASALLPLFIQDAFSDQATGLLGNGGLTAVLSDWTIAESVSATVGFLRAGRLTREQVVSALASMDSWTSTPGRRVDVLSEDVRAAESMLRRLDLPLRTPDALHNSIARRLEIPLVTFDAKMAASARQLGIEVVEI
jgi:uncharacterized protein